VRLGEPLITVELWRRLRAFDRRCFITIERRRPSHISPYAHRPRVWLAEMRPQDEKMWFREQAEHPEFAEVIRLLVDKGEQRGWHLALSPSAPTRHSE
jgi:hypothetical protein